ncbi:SsgA family sporulation/cell division regulator [Streptomyces milbemycinicus]|uniref:SsgA family sporulation/cell division regulator n=1 Tax=Streptomyces milbemycinicus TaxID=476552 RepID=UPI0033DF12CB
MSHHPAGAADEGQIVFTTTIQVTVANEPPVPLPAELRYAMTDPYAVCLSLGVPLAPTVDWVFARSLLAHGLHRPTGSGDVVVIPQHRHHPDAIRILLRRRNGAAVLEVATAAVTAFLRRSDVLVPPGTEHHHIDLDRVVQQLTAGIE